MVWLLLSVACSGDAPVVSGVTQEDVEKVTAERQAAEAKTRPEAVEQIYQKAPGVYVDVRFLSGRPYARVRDEIAAQLGDQQSTRDLGELGEERVFARGSVRVDVDGNIYMIEVPLPERVRRTDALTQVGLPVQVDRWQTLPMEFRLNNTFGLRRVIFTRATQGSEDVVRVQAWKYAPSERH